MTAVESSLHKGGHHRAEGTNIVEVVAHEVPELFVQMLVLFLCILQLVRVNPHIGAGLLIAGVQRNAVLNVDAIAVLPFFSHLHIITDLALEAHVRHKAVAGLGVHAGHIARIRVAIGIAVLHIEKYHEFITVLNGLRHCSLPPFW